MLLHREPEAAVSAGDVIDGKYRVERLIGSGGMGIVYAATHLGLDQLVALKFLRHEVATRPTDRFLREARATAKIKSEHVARVLDVGALDKGTPYIVFEYLEGSDLRRLIQEGEPAPVERAVDIVLEACEAIAEAHAHGIVHRDLKPANLFLARAGNGTDVVKVLDFGIAKSFVDDEAGTLTQSSDLLGSTKYMSPEQLRSSRDVTGRTDIWSLGVVLYELLAGAPPFAEGSGVEIGWAILNEPPRPLRELRDEVPAALEAIVRTCLEKQPEDRYPTVGALARSLAPFGSRWASWSVERTARWETTDDSSSTAVPVGDAPLAGPGRSPRRRSAKVSWTRRHLAIVGVVSAVPLAAVAAWAASTGPRVSPASPPASTATTVAILDPAEAPAPETTHAPAAPQAFPTASASPAGVAPAPPAPAAAERPRSPDARPKGVAGPTASPPRATAGGSARSAPVDTACPDPQCSRF